MCYKPEKYLGTHENSASCLFKKRCAYVRVLFIYVLLLPMQIILLGLNTGSKFIYTFREFVMLL